MKRLCVSLYELQEKDLDFILDGFPVLVYDKHNDVLKIVNKGIGELPNIKSRRYKCFLYKEPPATAYIGKAAGV